MKKIILAAIVAASAMTANAQVWIGGSLGFNSTTKEVASIDVTTTSFEIQPEIGYNLSDQWAVACALGFSTSKTENADAQNTFKINPYARYTFAKSGIASFFVDGGLSYTTYGEDHNRFGIGVQPGVAISLSDNFSFVTKLGSLGYSTTSNHDVDTNSFGLGVDGNAINFGLYYAF